MKKESLKLQAYNIIKEKIITCQYAPNTLLNEEILREEINVSRTPIRDALSRLEQEGLIKILPKKGIMVSGVSMSEINMIFEVRMLMEPYALRNYGYLIPEELIMSYYTKFSDQSRQYTIDEFFLMDDEFHYAIVNAIQNRFLLQTYADIHNQNLRFRVMTGKIQDNRLSETRKEHLSIVKACLKKDWELAAQELCAHLKRSKDATFDLLLDGQGPMI